jgi:hypothetical protein
MKTCLVVANQTLPGEPLATAVRERIAAGECTFHVVVPLTPVTHGGTWEEGETAEAARGRLAAFLGVVRAEGVEADGEIGDRDPIQAYCDVLEHKWILSESAGRDVGLDAAVQAYIAFGAPAPEDGTVVEPPAELPISP